MNQSLEQKVAPESGPHGVISALADGALDEIEAQHAIDLLLGSSALRDTWSELHWVGDCLRSEETGAMVKSAGFMKRFSEQLAAEATVLAPKTPRRPGTRRWLRYGLPSAAAVVVSTAVWFAIPYQKALVAQETVPSPQPLAVVADAKPPVTVNAVDPAQLNEYLAAHQEFGATALHGPGAIQAASFNIVADSAREHP